jgi:hypothetical protein
VRICLPNTREAAEYDAIVATASSTSVSGFTAADLKQAAARPDREPLPALWVVGRVDGELSGVIPSMWPISLAKLAEFVAGVRPAQQNV